MGVRHQGAVMMDPTRRAATASTQAKELAVTGRTRSAMELFRMPGGRGIALALGSLALAILVGLIALWPDSRTVDLGDAVVDKPDKAEVVSVSAEGCESFAGPGCKLAE